ncbi:hypothetical protein AB4232_22455 [Vibrio sp. 10N.286.46.A8]
MCPSELSLLLGQKRKSRLN